MTERNPQDCETGLKILQVVLTPPYAWETGGCARFVHEVSRTLAKMGHEVTILTTDMLHSGSRYQSGENPSFQDGVRIVRIRNLSDWLARRFKLYVTPGSAKYLRREISNFDIVHLQDLLSNLAIDTERYCRRYSIPYILTTHGSANWLRQRKSLNQTVRTVFASRVLMNASYITALNRSEAADLVALGVLEDRIVVIPNGIDADAYGSIPRSGGFRSRIGADENTSFVSYVGRIHESKGLDLLVEAFSGVVGCLQDTRLVLCGPDDGYLNHLTKQLRRLGLEDSTIITGFVSESEKMEVLVDSDVFVTPRFRGFPATFLEACLCGTPIVTTVGGDKLDWIDNRVGYVVEPRADSIREAVLRILREKETHRRLSEEGIKMARGEFSWMNVVRKLEALYFAASRG